MLDSMGRMAFGKYKGTMFCDVPLDYLIFLAESNRKKTKQLEDEIERRQLVEEANETIAEKIVNAGYRALATKCHPDAGGDPEAFRRLTASKEVLKELLNMLDSEESGQFGSSI